MAPPLLVSSAPVLGDAAPHDRIAPGTDATKGLPRGRANVAEASYTSLLLGAQCVRTTMNGPPVPDPMGSSIGEAKLLCSQMLSAPLGNWNWLSWP